MPWASLIPPACASLIQTVGIAGTVAFEQAVAFEFAQIVTELVQPVGMRGKLKRGEDGLVNLLAGRAADRVTAMQKDLHEPDDPRVMESDAGIADRADGDGESDPLQQGKVDVHVEALRLKVGKAVCDGLKLFAHGVEVIQAFA